MIHVSTVNEVGALIGKSFYTLWFSVDHGYHSIRFEVERVVLGRPKGIDGELGEVGIYLQAKNDEMLRRIPIEHTYETLVEAEMAIKRYHEEHNKLY
jgi:hypothetical protein